MVYWLTDNKWGTFSYRNSILNVLMGISHGMSGGPFMIVPQIYPLMICFFLQYYLRVVWCFFIFQWYLKRSEIHFIWMEIDEKQYVMLVVVILVKSDMVALFIHHVEHELSNCPRIDTNPNDSFSQSVPPSIHLSIGLSIHTHDSRHMWYLP